MLPLGVEQDLNLVPYCPACLDAPHGRSEDGEPLPCPEATRGGGDA